MFYDYSDGMYQITNLFGEHLMPQLDCITAALLIH